MRRKLVWVMKNRDTRDGDAFSDSFNAFIHQTVKRTFSTFTFPVLYDIPSYTAYLTRKIKRESYLSRAITSQKHHTPKKSSCITISPKKNMDCLKLFEMFSNSQSRSPADSMQVLTLPCSCYPERPSRMVFRTCESSCTAVRVHIP